MSKVRRGWAWRTGTTCAVLLTMDAEAAAARSDPVARLKSDGVTVVRSAGEYPSVSLVQYVARNAEPMSPAGGAGLAGRTARNVIERLCGSVQPGYEAELARANPGRAVHLDAALADDAHRIVWPACLYAVQGSPLPDLKAGPTDTRTGIAERFTGFGRFDRGRLQALFGTSNFGLAVNQPVQLRLLTAPTFLRLRVDFETFAREAGKLGNISVRAPEAAGSIIGPVASGCTGVSAAPSQPLDRTGLRSAYPFHPAAVAAAYVRTRGLATPDRIRVMMVDNGFWGVPCAGGDCPRRTASGELDFDEPFPKAFFPTDVYDGDIGPMLANEIAPVNYFNDIGHQRVDGISGHGTHVAGLITGGPSLYPNGRAIFGLPGSSWLKLTIGNIAPGGLSFARDADEKLFLMLSHPKAGAKPQVVNFSLALSASRADYITSVVNGGDWAGTLFVAAAGNDREAVEEADTYPAAFGGSASSNTVTVASVDADGTLSSFTNHSRALVDIAAPGCKISSWLTQAGPPEPLSGTSQAAPLVTFTAAAMKSLWPSAKPVDLKNRLSYSGALLQSAADRDRVVSGARLDIFQALLLRDDVVVARNPERILLGRVSKIEGFRCADRPTPAWDRIRAFKSDGATRLYSTQGSVLQTCEASLSPRLGASPNKVYVELSAVFENGAFVPRTGETDFPAQDLVELVRAELPN